MRHLILILAVLFTGCMNVTLQVTPENPKVQSARRASDCVLNVIGLSFGTATVENALADRVPKIPEAKAYRDAVRSRFKSPSSRTREEANSYLDSIVHIRYVALHLTSFLGLFGAQCVEVVGEGESDSLKGQGTP